MNPNTKPILHYHFEPIEKSSSSFEQPTIALVNPTEENPMFQLVMERLLLLKSKKFGTFLGADNIKDRLILEEIESEVTPNYTSVSISGEIEREVLEAFEVILGSIYDGHWDYKDFVNYVKRYELGGDTEGLAVSGEVYKQEKASLGDLQREFLELNDSGMKKGFSCSRDTAFLKQLSEEEETGSEDAVLKRNLEFSGLEP